MMNPLLEELASMPEFLERTARRMGEANVKVSGPEGGFSLLEHAWHLADLETEGFGERIRRLRTEDDPFLADFQGDRIARERQYSLRDITEGMRRFRAAREANLHALHEVTSAEWDRKGVLEDYGPLTLRDLVLLMSEHDQSHRAEIGRLPGMDES
jgi:DinB superfamily